MKTIAVIVCFIVFSDLFHPSVVIGDVAKPEETPTYVQVTGVILGATNFVSIVGNTSKLVRHEPSKLYGYLGILGGTLSIGFAFVLSEEQPSHESTAILFGISGGISMGLGGFGLRSAKRGPQQETSRFQAGPVLVRESGGYVPGIGISYEF
jgi:hypothetical protein